MIKENDIVRFTREPYRYQTSWGGGYGRVVDIRKLNSLNKRRQFVVEMLILGNGNVFQPFKLRRRAYCDRNHIEELSKDIQVEVKARVMAMEL